MSLLVWLPMNGNIINRGLSDLKFSVASTNTTVNTNGKIGSCYYNNSFSAGGLYSDAKISLPTSHSMFCWFKFESLNSASALGGGLVTVHNISTINGTGITIKYVSSTTGYLSLNTANGTSRTYNQYCGTTLLQANTWYHGGFTYDGSNIRIYLNGNLETTQAYTGMIMGTEYVGIFMWSMNSQTGYAGYKFNGWLNDVRIYDHTLSTKEVKEIAKGLMLHYKFDSPFIENTTNFASASQACPDWTTVAIGQNVGSLGSCNVGNYTVTYSAYIKNTSSVNVNVRMSPIYTGGSYAVFQGNVIAPGCEGWSTVTADISDSSTYTGNISVYFQNGAAGTVPTMPNIQVRHLQIERKNHRTAWTTGGTTRTPSSCYDNSGNGYTGTVSGTLFADSSTPRYRASTYFDGNTSVIENSMNLNPLLNSQCTINFWINSVGESGARSVYFGNYSTSANFNLEKYTNNKLRFYWSGTDTYSTGTITDGIWKMVTIVCNGLSSLKIYFNGELDTNSTATRTTYNFPSPWRIGRDSRTGATAYKGYMSDFRIYATALSEDDIKELYNTSMTVDNKGTIFARELMDK